MDSLFRAARPALHHPLPLCAAIACSLLVGGLWGANITTIYPFVQVVFQGESLQDSLRRAAGEAREQHARLATETDRLRNQLAEASPEARAALRGELAEHETRLRGQQLAVRAQEARADLADRWLPASPFATLALVMGLVVGMTLLKSLFFVISEVLVARVTNDILFRLQNEFYRRTLRLEVATFRDDRTSSLISCFTHRLQALSGALRTLFGQAVREPLKMAVCLIGAAVISWRLLLLSLVLAPLGVLLLRGLTQAIRRGSRRDLSLVSEVYKQLSESFFGIVAVKSFSLEPQQEAEFERITSRLTRRRNRNALFLALTNPVAESMGIGIICIAVLVSGYLVLNRETHLLGVRICDQPLSPAALMVFYGLLAGVADPARKLSGIHARLVLGATAGRQVYRMLDREPRIADPPDPRPVPCPFERIVLDDVSFWYQPDTPVLRDIQLEIRFGERIAIVGPNGCGKSTLVQLLARLYDPRRGTIRLDGIPLQEFRLRDLRGQISMVSQDTWLFDDTVLNNIRCGRPGASEQEVIRAAERAHAHGFIVESLDNGYQTVVGERGSRLSGGQRQRIALARAILRDPPLLILDEATSEIDLESEQAIHQALRDFTRNRTTIFITHRLGALDLADRIIVMDSGRIADAGSHVELLRRCPHYQRLHLLPSVDAA